MAACNTTSVRRTRNARDSRWLTLVGCLNDPNGIVSPDDELSTGTVAVEIKLGKVGTLAKKKKTKKKKKKAKQLLQTIQGNGFDSMKFVDDKDSDTYAK